MKKRNDLFDQLELSSLQQTNKTTCFGRLGLPSLSCNINILPDYIALYTQPADYHRTSRTCVAFYNYDKTFDGKNGLYNSIQYNDSRKLEEFKERFKGVKYFITPDYSVCGDCPPYRNYYQMGKAREVAIWLTLNCDGIVLPNISCASIEDLPVAIENYKDVSTVAFSTKGKLRNKYDRTLLECTIKYTVDHMPQLKNIVVYDVSCDNACANVLFSYAKEHGVNVCIPNNMVKIRNCVSKIRRARI